MKDFSHTIDLPSILTLLKIKESELPTRCLERLRTAMLRYRPLTQEERDSHILRVLTRLEEEGIRRTTAENISAFEEGWKYNLDLCRTKGVTRENLKPRYVRPYPHIRFLNDYIAPENPYLLDDLLWIAVNQSFEHFRDLSTIYEFGCGTGQYLFDLSQVYPDKDLVGTDWTESSVALLGLMRAQGMRVQGTRFDFLKPEQGLKIASNAGVITIGALEQVGPNFRPFLNYLLEQGPALVVHLEPIAEFYDPAHLYGYLGLSYHRRRQYLDGLLTELRVLETQGKVELVDASHLPFGDPFHESASRIVWRPR